MKHLSVWLLLCIAVPVCAARTVTDQLGRTIQVPEHPHRLVCLMPSVVDDVYALGAGADVIAVTDYTKYPAEARTKPSVGSILAPSMETIVSMHPDLVLGSADMSHTETLQQLERLGIVVFMISTHGVGGIYQSIASLGQALNREDSARELIARLRGREAAVRRQVKGKPVVSVLMPVGYNPIVTIGKHAFITELIEIAGGRSVTSDIDQEWPQISLEAVLARAPEALLLIRGSKMSTERIREQPGWNNLPAVRNNRIYFVDDRVEIPGPVAFDALEELAKQFHP
ncbi:MAG: ABC transporter substrate-binding protein [Terracidiphilus sp.]|jgi:iron complex transport system substrate-binding protein